MKRIFVLTGGVVVVGEVAEYEGATPLKFTDSASGFWLKDAKVNELSIPRFFVPKEAIVAEGEGTTPLPPSGAVSLNGW